MEPKDAGTQKVRIERMVGEVVGQYRPGLRFKVSYDVVEDRVVVAVDDRELKFGPKEWFLADQQLRDLVVARLHPIERP
jgi:hypothetical protein